MEGEKVGTGGSALAAVVLLRDTVVAEVGSDDGRMVGVVLIVRAIGSVDDSRTRLLYAIGSNSPLATSSTPIVAPSRVCMSTVLEVGF